LFNRFSPRNDARGYSLNRLGTAQENGGASSPTYQQTDSVNYLVEASYSVGMMTSETYPSVPGATDRRVVTYTPDSAGRLSSLASNATTYAPTASVSSIGYASHNALKTETYGSGLIHAVTYNNRLQPTEIKLGTSGNSTSVIDLNYSYGTTSNNGNVQSYTYGGGGLSYTHSFSYDSLNRLSSATETNGGTTNWTQNNAYDRYGNRQIDYGGGSYNLSFSSTTNRITTSGFSYDSNGNLTNDAIHAYTFDAENKILKVDSTTAYAYDGEGHRVRKYVGDNIRFVYGIDGQLIAEFDGSTGNLKKEYVYGGATLVTIEPTAVNSNGTQYTTSDNLGSPRVITNSSASVVGRHDYMPFGEDLGAGTGGRTTGMGFSNSGDNNRKKFTGYERDAESGLDFAEARYYANAQGRFTSPDPFSASAIIADPQTFNRYAYCRNNPVNSVDPSGMNAHAPTPASIGAAEREQAEEAGHAVIEEEEARYEEYVHDAELGLLNNTSVTVMISEDPTKDDSSAADDSKGGDPRNPAVIFDSVELLDEPGAGYPQGPLGVPRQAKVVATGIRVENAPNPNTYSLDLDVEKVDAYSILAIRVTFHAAKDFETEPSSTSVSPARSDEATKRYELLEEYLPGTGRKATQTDFGQVTFRVKATGRDSGPRGPDIMVTVGATKKLKLMDINNPNYKATNYTTLYLQRHKVN